MNSNQNNNLGKGGGNKRNMTAIVSILLWALVLTLLVNLATSRLQQANSVEVSYGQFRQLIMQDAVESVVMSSGKYTFTLKEGYSLSVGEDGEVTVRTPEEGGQDSQAAQAPQESGTTGGVLDLPLLDGTAPQQQPVQSQNQAQSAGGRESLVYFCAPITQASIRDDDLSLCWRSTASPISAPNTWSPSTPFCRCCCPGSCPWCSLWWSSPC